MYEMPSWMNGFTPFDAACLEVVFSDGSWSVSGANRKFMEINRIDPEHTPVERWDFRTREYFERNPEAAAVVMKVLRSGIPARLALPIGDVTALTDWLVLPVAQNRIGFCGLPDDSILSAKKLYHDFFRQSEDPFLILEGDQFKDGNPAALKMLGLSGKEELYGLHPWTISPPCQPDGSNSGKKAEELIQKAILEGHIRFEWVHLNKSGESLFLDIQLTVCDEEQANRLFVVWRDISLMKQLEQQLKAEQQRFLYALQATDDAIWDWNIKTDSVYFSDRYYTMLGFNPGDFPASFTSWEGLLHPDDLDDAKSAVLNHLSDKNSGFEIEFRMRCRDGMYKWIQGHGMVVEWNSSGEPVRMVGTHSDIDRRHQSDELIRNQRTRLKTTLDAITDGVIGVDDNGTVETINPAARKILDLQDEGIGGPVTSLLRKDGQGEEESWAAFRDRFLTDGNAGTVQNGLFLISGGRRKLLRVTGNRLNAGDHAASGAVFVFQDITREKELNEQLEHARKMEVVGQLAGGVAHDFNNMLTGIRGAAELLALQLPEAPFLDVILQSVDRAADLTRKLLDFSRKGKVFSTPVDMHSSIRHAVELLERSVDRRIAIVKQLNARIPVVVGDPAQLENALLNLGLNARDALPEGGTISFATENLRLSLDRCRELSLEDDSAEYLAVVVQDNGSGIPPELLPKIFEPFFTTKEIGQGTGLGLAAVYGMVKSMHGAVDAVSSPGNGTRITLYLPVEMIAVPSPVFTPPPEQRSWHGRVLLVEDERVVRITARRMLEELGFTVDTAQDGLVAIENVRNNQYDLAVMDLVMPRKHGKDAFRELRALDGNLPVLIVSGFTMNTAVQELLDAGAAGFIAKPYSLGDLQEHLHRAVPHLYAGE